MFEWVLEE